MKALFIYDGPMYGDNCGNYYSSVLNDKMFERYFSVADELTILIRVRNRELSEILNMSKLSNPKITLRECPNLSSLRGLIDNTKKTVKIIKEEISKADIIFIRLPSIIGNISVDIAKNMSKPYLIEVVGCPWDAYWNYSFKSKILAPIGKYLMKKRVKQGKFVLYVTKEFLQNRYPTNALQINCSNVELPRIDKLILEKRINNINKKRKNSKIILGTAAGLDVAYKGQEYIILALSKLKKMGITNFEYQVIGGGTGERLKKIAKECKVEDQFKIVGELSHDEVFTWLDNLDIYCQPSRQEGLPRAVIEAMSRGIPCIGARTAGIPELLNDKCVFSNSKREIDEIVNILLKISNNSKILIKLAKENFEESQNYDREILKQRRTAFFQKFKNSINKKEIWEVRN